MAAETSLAASRKTSGGSRPEVANRYPELITPVRELLNETGRP
jgi:hypothetical protein